MNLEKHSSWLAYLWACLAGYFAHWTLDDWGALIGIVLAAATFLVNRHYKRRSVQVQARQTSAMERRNQILEKLAGRPDSSVKSLVLTAEEQEMAPGAGDEK
ncbi:phage holin family protein [Salmonella enterica]|nr:phage holin family protein [Salmonella enterica]